MKVVFLKPGRERKVLNGYPWVFHDEVKEIIGDPDFGDLVNVFSSDSTFLGKAFYGKRIRMVTRSDEDIDLAFFKKMFERALSRRSSFKNPYYRLFYAEADGVPGLVVDRYGGGFVVQLRNRGVQRYRNDIVDALIEIFQPSFIHERSDFETDIGEGIERRNETLYGEVKDVFVVENDLKFRVDVVRGQKTGFFYDQRRNRLKVRELGGKTALDLYTYTGGFALNFASAGFDVVGVDISESDVGIARMNAEMNGLSVDFVVSDVLEYLDSTELRFDVVVADPPSLIKSKREKKKAVEFFTKLVSKVNRVLKEGGVFVICSCAHHADESILLESLRRGVEGTGIFWRVWDVTFQDVDHPWIAQIPETLYLRCVWAFKEGGT